jgi:hypothetical protein
MNLEERRLWGCKAVLLLDRQADVSSPSSGPKSKRSKVLSEAGAKLSGLQGIATSVRTSDPTYEALHVLK